MMSLPTMFSSFRFCDPEYSFNVGKILRMNLYDSMSEGSYLELMSVIGSNNCLRVFFIL